MMNPNVSNDVRLSLSKVGKYMHLEKFMYSYQATRANNSKQTRLTDDHSKEIFFSSVFIFFLRNQVGIFIRISNTSPELSTDVEVRAIPIQSINNISKVWQAMPKGNDNPIFSSQENLNEIAFTKENPMRIVNIIPVNNMLVLILCGKIDR